MDDLVLCHVCGIALHRSDAVESDEKETPEGRHWGWAHRGCAAVIWEEDGADERQLRHQAALADGFRALGRKAQWPAAVR
jgi:hypothetical protein